MRKWKLSSIILILGILLLAAALGLLIFSRLRQKQAAKDAAYIVTQLRTLIPKVHSQVPDDRVNTVMPAIEVDGVSYCGIIELPAYGTELPIREPWDRSAAITIPCRYLGSIYDGSLIIGGSDQEGQLDFIQHITKGERVYITDTTGGKYAYTVSVVKKSSDVGTDYLTGIDADLVLFARNTYSLDYTVVGCRIDFTNDWENSAIWKIPNCYIQV